MISLEKLLEIFQETDFPQKALVRFYRSSIQQVCLASFLKGQAKQKILKLEEKYQWPVLKHLNDPNLEIYRDADRELRDMFIELTNEEARVRTRSWKELRSVIEQRAKLYKYIFDFNKKDMEYCRKLAERYEKQLLKRKKNRLLKTLATGVAGAAGAGIYFYAKIKHRK